MKTERLLRNNMNSSFNVAVEFTEKYRLYWMERAIEKHQARVSMLRAFLRKKQKEREDREFREFFSDLCDVIQRDRENKK